MKFIPSELEKENSDILEHHGILGQKWGKKQGPPYPLDAADHSSKEKADGYKKSIGGGRNEELYDRKTKKSEVKTEKKEKFSDKEVKEYRDKLVKKYEKSDPETAKFVKTLDDDAIRQDMRNKEKTKKALIIAGTVVGVSLAAYLVYKMKTVNNFDAAKKFMDGPSVDNTDNAIKKLLEKGLDIDSANKIMTLKMSGKTIGDMDIIKAIKPNIMGDMDLILKDAQFKRVDFHKDFDLNKVANPLFVAITERDANKYKWLLGNRVAGPAKKQQIVMNALDEIRIPSREKTKQILKELADTDPDFEKEMINALGWIVKKNNGGVPVADWRVEGMLRGMINNPKEGLDYSVITAIGGANVDLNAKITKAFSDKGYNALLDLHDVVDKVSDLPLILLDPKKQASVTKKIALL